MSKTPDLKTNHDTEVKKIFSAIAPNYDRANKAISLGMDTGWRKKLIRWSKAPPDAKILDCATGTGALAFEFQKELGPKAQITGIDFCEQMLKQARLSQPAPGEIKFQLADMHNLPFPDHFFDVCSIAYGLRNAQDPIKTLTEMARVTKPGGKVMILETGDRPMLLVYPFFHLHFRYIVPFIGGLLTGQKSAYQYLQKTSRRFPSRHLLLKLMQETQRFSKCEYKTLFFGASFLYKAHTKPTPNKHQNNAPV